MRLLNRIQDLDTKAFYQCQKQRHNKWIIGASKAVSYTANGPFYGLAGAFFIASKHYTLALSLACGFIVERSLYWVCKNSFQRNRPREALPNFESVITPSDRFSFPSGHTSAAFLVATLVASAFPAIAPLLLLWASAVGLARVLLGVHFPCDTLAGAALGTSLAFGVLAFL
jgi:undecaprenyl-diphosphatase